MYWCGFTKRRRASCRPIRRTQRHSDTSRLSRADPIQLPMTDEHLPEWVRIMKAAYRQSLERDEQAFLKTPEPERIRALSATPPNESTRRRNQTQEEVME